jgi:hypothetical protein
MFYDTNKVDIALICQDSEVRLDIPKMLPSGETICSLCDTSIQMNVQILDCLVCKDKHYICLKIDLTLTNHCQKY